MKVFVSGLVNVETTLNINSFPVTYYPVDYPFFGINSSVSGVGFNVAKALKTLGDDVVISSIIGNDFESEYIKNELTKIGLSMEYVKGDMRLSASSVVLNEKENGRRQVYCDLKDVQERCIPQERVESVMAKSDIAVLCNINFNRNLLLLAKRLEKKIATDVHVISNIYDEYNRDFMRYADILFMSDENISTSPHEFLLQLKAEYGAEVIVMGLGANGAIAYERKTDTITHVEAFKTENVVNTVGAGDALFSSFIHYYSKFDAITALKYAQAFAALKIRTSGGANGFADETTVEKFINGERV